ncbi:hypothetical protein BN1708_008968 [Verticillium longisporum]|uniref:Uncharacterized protein n=1 Tax=Verticillium longisporum TaxID=100787 RepID=A0A0G4N9R8_VERLO|nr:hypothetical protein BN1708_008968 [Verticillium longisporum]
MLGPGLQVLSGAWSGASHVGNLHIDQVSKEAICIPAELCPRPLFLDRAIARRANSIHKHEPGLHFKEFEFLHKIMHPSTTQMPSQASGARG